MTTLKQLATGAQEPWGVPMDEEFFCGKPCSKYGHLCTKPSGHSGACSHTHVSRAIRTYVDPRAGEKLRCDSYITPGNKGAAKNRGDRCEPVQYSRQQIYEANRRGEVGVCIPQRFASTPYDCFKINIELAIQIVSIKGFDASSAADNMTMNYLVNRAKERYPQRLRCRICQQPILLDDFHTEHGTSGANSAQLGHIVPHPRGKDQTAHIAGNTQWIHRDCNIIQGEKTEDETLEVLAGILESHGFSVNKEAVA